MTQEQVVILCLRIGLIAGFVSIVAWVAVYTRLTRRAAWKNPIGQTLIANALLTAGLFVPTTLSLFFRLTRQDSLIVAWTDAVLIGAVTPVMIHRAVLWLRLHRLGRLPRNGNDGQGGAQ